MKALHDDGSPAKSHYPSTSHLPHQGSVRLDRAMESSALKLEHFAPMNDRMMQVCRITSRQLLDLRHIISNTGWPVSMQSPTQASQSATEEEFASGDVTIAEDAGADIQEAIEPTPTGTVELELNFNAFADHVPPTQHAKRVATGFDPSIQDFADQALEVSALRAELNRIGRECDALRKTLRLRESLVQTLREQLAASRAAASAGAHAEQTQSLTPDPVPSPTPVIASKHSANPIEVEHPVSSSAPQAAGERSAGGEHDGSSTVVLEASRNHFGATITDLPQVERDSGVLESTPGRKLVPEDQGSHAIVLNRDIITIGRTQQNDICIPSYAVSRDHARLLVSAKCVTLFDMNSANGCFVNDEPIKRQKLRDGDRVRIGDRYFQFVDHVRGTRAGAP